MTTVAANATAGGADPLLAVRGLSISFATPRGVVRATDDVSFDVLAGATTALVGESGCGKSVTSLALLRLLPSPPARIERGSIRFEGRELLALPEREMRALRGKSLSMIFQEPMTSLNPVYTVGAQIVEAIRLHEDVTRKEAQRRAVELLATVGIPAPADRAGAYPHELSGGMRQRVMIAMALSCEPKLLVADEPTTALDVTIQAQILDLIRKLSERMRMGVLFVTHDLGVVAELASDMVVMYAGRVVERGPVAAVFASPRHPYTAGLLASVPRIARARAGGEALRRLPTIEGMVPDLAKLPSGCRFRERCHLAEPRCAEAEPPLAETEPGRSARCFFPERVGPS